ARQRRPHRAEGGRASRVRSPGDRAADAVDRLPGPGPGGQRARGGDAVKNLRDIFLLLIVLILQSTLAHRIAIAGVRPDLLVAFVVYFAWMRGPVSGVACGFTVGLL